MTSLTSAAKGLVQGNTSTDKTKCLEDDTITPSVGSGLTTDHGVKISDTDNWLKVSDGVTVGPSLLEDQIAREKIHRFDHERIPERVVHARGAGAHGYFRVFDSSAEKYTFAPVLTDTSRKTSVFVRFSTVQGSRGSADTVRDVRGFAIKMYTEEGNWDIVGNDIPVFFIQEAIKFPDFVHAVKPEPHNEVPQGQSAHNNFWDFVGLQPESAHMVMWVMSDRGIPRSFRMMQGFGVNTYTLINGKGERHFVKFHLIPELGVHSLVWDEVLKICGQDPDFHRKDLHEAIESGCPAKWTFAIQTIAESDEHNFEFDILDATKVWPEELVPLQTIGELVLDRTVNEFFPETGAGRLLHLSCRTRYRFQRLIRCCKAETSLIFDTQDLRLGLNWEQLPINKPVDGKHQSTIIKSNVNYWPNRNAIGQPVPPAQGGYAEYPQKVPGIKQRVRGAKFQEHFNQAQLFYNTLTPHERAHLISALSFELSHCDDPVVYETYTNVLNNIDYDLSKIVARNNPGKTSPALSQTYYFPKVPTIASRRIAILVADGFDQANVEGMQGAIRELGALPFLIGPRRGRILPKGGKSEGMMVDHHFEGQRSTLFDAVLVPSGVEHAKILSEIGRTVHWIRESFGHCKAIGAIGDGADFVRNALAVPGVNLSGNDDVVVSYGVVTVGNGQSDLYSTGDFAKGKKESKVFASAFALEISKHRCWERETEGLTCQVAY
ncbi:catalase [Armillaria borealis]|uniref:Catalase n=1 Tax=Armillaria borealis TaxID=47425 RepID=A0AA39MRV9_9AGAR|nr:catalase [Armillaria borealis]